MAFPDLTTISPTAEDMIDCEKQGIMASPVALDVDRVKTIPVTPSTAA